VIEQEAVLAPAGEHVQAEADAPEECLPGLEFFQLARRQKIVSDQLIERPAAEMSLRDPADHLDVA